MSEGGKAPIDEEIQVCDYECVCMYIIIHTYSRTYVCMHVQVYVCNMYVCMYVVLKTVYTVYKVKCVLYKRTWSA